MTFLIFIIILGILVFVHELGHFLLAKSAGVRVDEFGFGYPPRALIIGKKWGTLFTLNWIPFGGFVKIFGEDYEEKTDFSSQKSFSSKSPRVSSPAEAGSARLFSENFFLKKNLSFVEVSKKWQVAILASGVTFNILFAWFLFSFGFLVGLPTSVDNNFGGEVKNPVLTVTGLLSDSPAQQAGLKTGDKIKSVSENNRSLEILNPENMSDFVNKSKGPISLKVDRGDQILNFEVNPKSGIVENKKIIGVEMDMVGTLSLPLYKAFYEGGKATLKLCQSTILGISGLIKDAVKGQADISQISGPVGIIGLVGDASRLGFVYLLTFTALISINLAIINFLPFPALDGGRIVFVIFEGLTGEIIKPKIAQIVNTAGFFLLIALMLFITYRDILKLF